MECSAEQPAATMAVEPRPHIIDTAPLEDEGDDMRRLRQLNEQLKAIVVVKDRTSFLKLYRQCFVGTPACSLACLLACLVVLA